LFDKHYYHEQFAPKQLMFLILKYSEFWIHL